jgi:RsmE family RNA methyltransferase
VNVILLEPSEVDANGHATVRDARAVHLRDVLHIVPGSNVRIGVIDGALGTACVQTIDAHAIELRCAFDAIPPRPPVDLLLALPRPKVMRRLWAQLAALGVGRIILTNAERVERPYFDTHVLSPACYRPLLIEGLQQARDTRLPVVSIHRRFRVLVEDELDALSAGARRLVADPHATMSISAAAEDAERVLLAVGPEGGWNAFEIDLLVAHGFQPVSLGARTLRTDTACVALLALVHAAIPRVGV